MPARDDMIDDLRSAACAAGRAIPTAECEAALGGANGDYNQALLELGLPGGVVAVRSSCPTAVVAGTPVVDSGTTRGEGTTFRAHLHQISASPAVAVVQGAPVQPARSLSRRLYDRLPSSSDLYNALPSRPRVSSGRSGQPASREPILSAATPRSDAATLRSPDAPRPARQPSRPVQLARQASRTLYATVAPPPPSEECTTRTVFGTIKYRPSWCQVDGSAPSACPVLPKAQGAPMDPKAPRHSGSEARHGLRRPPRLRGPPRPPEAASACAEDGDFARSTTNRYLWILGWLSWLSFYYTPTSIATNTYVIQVAEASPRWPQAQCTLLGPTSLLSLPLGGRGETRLSYRIDARVRFETVHLDPLTNQIDATVVTSTAHQYPTDRYWVTDAVARSDTHAEQLAVKAALDEAYGNGATVPCWYNPSEPADVMLTQHPSVLTLSGPNSLEKARMGKLLSVAISVGVVISVVLVGVTYLASTYR